MTNALKACRCLIALALAGGCVSRPPDAPHETPGPTPPHVEAAADIEQTMDYPPGPLVLNTDETLLLAFENNRSLRIIRLEPAMRTEQENIARAAFDPAIAADATERRAKIQGRESSDALLKEEATSLGADLTMTHPLGTRVGLDIAADRTSLEDAEKHTARIGLTLAQPLLQGAGRNVNLAELRLANLDTRLSEYEVRAISESLAAQAESAYWRYVLALKRIDMVQESLLLAENQLTETRHLIRVGELPPTEEAAAETEIALRREALIDAESRMRILRVRLLRLIQPGRLGHPFPELIVENKVEPTTETVDPVEEHVAAALRYRPDINQARLRLQQGEIELVRTANGILPRLDLFLRLGKTGYADALGKAFSELDGDAYEARGGLAFEWPVANRAARARHRRAEWAYEQKAESLRNMADLVREDVHIAHVEVLRASEQTQAKASTRRLQEETLRAEAAKYTAGKSTALLVAAAQRALLAAQVAEAEAMIEHRIALSTLHRLDGTLLMRRGILAPGIPKVMSWKKGKE